MPDLRPPRERLARVFSERAASRIMELLDLRTPVRILVTIERDRNGKVHVELQPPKNTIPWRPAGLTRCAR